MASASNSPRSADRAGSPRELAQLLRAASRVAIALAVVFVLDVVGAIAAIDDGLRSRYVTLAESVGASRESSELIVVVAGDRDTVEAWGPPPWPAERLAELVEQIDAGDPDMIAALGHTQMFTRDEQLDALLEDHGAGLLLPSADEQLHSPWTSGGLEHGDLVLGDDSSLAEIAVRSDRLAPLPERLPVHWLTPASRLPVVPAHQVASGKIPARTFARRVVLLGVTDPSYAMPIATPVGLLSPVEVEAHALTGFADGRVWLTISPLWSYLGCAGLAALLLMLLGRARGPRMTIGVLALAPIVLLVDFALYERGLVRLGSGHALLTIAAIWMSHWIYEATVTFVELRRLRTRVLREAAAAQNRSEEDDDVGFWDDLAELGAEYAQEVVGGAAAATVIERKEHGWALAVQASAKLDRDSHAYIANHEHLDLRRAPFRSVWLTLRASWTADLLPRGPTFGERQTLIVPLEDDGELLGLWLVHLSVDGDDAQLDREELATFERLGQQMATALVRRRERQALLDQSGDTSMTGHVETIVGGLRMLHDEHRWALELLEQLPVRAIIATVWGDLEFVDPRLRSDLARRYPGLFSEDMPEQNLRAVLARLTGSSLEDAHRLMRKVVRNGVAIELDAVPGIEDSGDVWVMSRIQSKRSIDLPGFKPAVNEHILLMARSSTPAQTVKTPSGAVLRVLSGS